MEDLTRLYDRIIADVMGYIVVHANNENNGKNVVYVDINEPESMFLFHCAMNVGSAFAKLPVYVDSSLWHYIKLWKRYHKQITMKRAKRKDRPFDFQDAYTAAAEDNAQGHVTWMYRDIYDEYYKGDHKW